MNERKDRACLVLWAEDLEEIEREIARLAQLCEIRILEPRVISRVLHGDTSVCGTHNPLAFRMLREMLMLRLAVRDKMGDAFGQAKGVEFPLNASAD